MGKSRYQDLYKLHMIYLSCLKDTDLVKQRQPKWPVDFKDLQRRSSC